MRLRGLTHAHSHVRHLCRAGFTDVCAYAESPNLPLGPEEVREHLHAFWRAQIGEPCVVVGASLGGTVAMDFALRHADAVNKVVLIDAQGYIDGIGPASQAPRWVSKLGVSFLRTTFLRGIANKMAYHDVEQFATQDALLTGRLHTFARGWLEAKVAFIQSGGYVGIAKRVCSSPSSICGLICQQVQATHSKTTVLDMFVLARVDPARACILVAAFLGFRSTDSHEHSVQNCTRCLHSFSLGSVSTYRYETSRRTCCCYGARTTRSSIQSMCKSLSAT